MAVQSAIQLLKGQPLQQAGGQAAAKKEGGEGQGEGARDDAFGALLAALVGAMPVPQKTAQPASAQGAKTGLPQGDALLRDTAIAMQAGFPPVTAESGKGGIVSLATAGAGLATAGSVRPLTMTEGSAAPLREEAAAPMSRVTLLGMAVKEDGAAKGAAPQGQQSRGKMGIAAVAVARGAQEKGTAPVMTDRAALSGAEPPEWRAPAMPAAEPAVAAAKGAETAAARPAGPPAAQAALQVASMMRTGKESVRFELTPADLGRVTIRLKIKEGQTRLVIAVEKPAALEALRIGSPNLQSALQSAGVDIESQDMRFELEGGRQDLADRERGEGEPRRETGRAAAEGEADASRAALEQERGHGAEDGALFL